MTSKKDHSKDSLINSSSESSKTKSQFPTNPTPPSPSTTSSSKFLGETSSHERNPDYYHAEKKKVSSESLQSQGSRKKGPTSCIRVKYDVGFNNSIYLRGAGADLSWDHGILLKNIKADEWIWETETPFTNCEFKVLINDRQYELGENHHLQCGSSFEYKPNFHSL